MFTLQEKVNNVECFSVEAIPFYLGPYIRHGYCKDKETCKLMFVPNNMGNGVIQSPISSDIYILYYDVTFLRKYDDNNEDIKYPCLDPYKLLPKSQCLCDGATDVERNAYVRPQPPKDEIRIILNDSIFEDYVHDMYGVIITKEAIKNAKEDLSPLGLFLYS